MLQMIRGCFAMFLVTSFSSPWRRRAQHLHNVSEPVAMSRAWTKLYTFLGIGVVENWLITPISVKNPNFTFTSINKIWQLWRLRIDLNHDNLTPVQYTQGAETQDESPGMERILTERVLLFPIHVFYKWWPIQWPDYMIKKLFYSMHYTYRVTGTTVVQNLTGIIAKIILFDVNL